MSAGLGSATTVTFDYLADGSHGGLDLPYVENGVTVTARGGMLGSHTMPGALHIDDAGTGFASAAHFSTGSTFDVLGFTFTSLGFNFQGEAPEVIGNILISGFLGGVRVVSDHVTMSPVFGTVQSIVLDAAFAGLDGFAIELLYPVTGQLCDAPCGHIDLDSVAFGGVGLAPVPLPASGLLLGATVFGLVAMRRRKANAA